MPVLTRRASRLDTFLSNTLGLAKLRSGARGGPNVGGMRSQPDADLRAKMGLVSRLPACASWHVVSVQAA